MLRIFKSFLFFCLLQFLFFGFILPGIWCFGIRWWSQSYRAICHLAWSLTHSSSSQFIYQNVIIALLLVKDKYSINCYKSNSSKLFIGIPEYTVAAGRFLMLISTETVNVNLVLMKFVLSFSFHLNYNTYIQMH